MTFKKAPAPLSSRLKVSPTGNRMKKGIQVEPNAPTFLSPHAWIEFPIMIGEGNPLPYFSQANHDHHHPMITPALPFVHLFGKEQQKLSQSHKAWEEALSESGSGLRTVQMSVRNYKLI